MEMMHDECALDKLINFGLSETTERRRHAAGKYSEEDFCTGRLRPDCQPLTL